MTRRLLGALAIGLLAVACVGGPGGSAGPASASPSASAGRVYRIATGPGDLVLSVDVGGGLVPSSYVLTHLPQLVLYGDGRLIVPGPQREIYPAPLLPSLREIRLTPAEVQTILRAADAAGLLGPDAHFDATGIYDAGTTVFRTTVDGVTHTISAYALFESNGIQAENPAARARLSAFQRQIGDLAALLGRSPGDAEFEPAGMRVFVSPADPAEPPGLTRQVLPWPVAADPARAGQAVRDPFRCLVLDGPDLATFLAAAKTANGLTVWTATSGRYAVAVRPLLPGETGCGTAAS